jgi:protein-tyrosine phosphatase
MVCWGNICRSPTAEAILRCLASAKGIAIEVDSAGTSDEHRGDPPHRRAVAEAHRRGIDLRGLRARQIRLSDFAEFDLILTADQMVDRIVRLQAPPGSRARIMRMTQMGPDFNKYPDVPDPYYGTEDDYSFVFDLLERALDGLVESLSNLDADAELRWLP